MNLPTQTTKEEIEIINAHVFPSLQGCEPFLARKTPGLLMGYTEVAFFNSLLSSQRPTCAIEIGTETGATLAAIARYSKQVVSIDIDPGVQARLSGSFPNVAFVTGSSQQLLRPVIQKITEQGLSVDFVFIDGDHSADGVRTDIEAFLTYRPSKQLVIVMHDSFNPECRRGILAADWASSPYCHFVDVDFAPGVLHPDAPVHRQMWGGLAYALFLPEPRQHPLRILATHQLLYEAALLQSVYASHLTNREVHTVPLRS
jgi:SAM-dependent methyltransferase